MAQSKPIGNFRLLKLQGDGAFSQVYSAVNLLINHPVAIKKIPRQSKRDAIEHFQNEINIIEKLSHPYLLHSFQTFEDDKNFYHVTELADGGSLFTYVNNKGALSENEARFIFYQLVSVIEYLHLQKSIVHRDLKLENILLDRDKRIRLIDFGFSKEFTQEKMNEMVGSPAYVAPEIALGKSYNSKVDVWSLGVILYAITVGKLPFNGTSMEMQLKRIVLVNPFFPPQLSSNLIDLLKKLLQKDPNSRIKIDDIKQHPWLKAFDSEKEEASFAMFNDYMNLVDEELIEMLKKRFPEMKPALDSNKGNSEGILTVLNECPKAKVIYDIMHLSKVRNHLHIYLNKAALPLMHIKPSTPSGSNLVPLIRTRNENMNANGNENPDRKSFTSRRITPTAQGRRSVPKLVIHTVNV